MNPDIALERVNYFPGQLLSASDLKTEQEYFLGRLRRHNRYLHGWGVVSGLTVSVGNSAEIVITPGVAIDCHGNEIHVCPKLRFPIPNGPKLQFVVIQYAETETSPTPALGGSAGPPTGELSFTRIREGFHIDIIGVDPTSDHRGKGPGTPGCGRLHQLCLARLRKSPRSWKVELKGRRRA